MQTGDPSRARPFCETGPDRTLRPSVALCGRPGKAGYTHARGTLVPGPAVRAASSASSQAAWA
eukprot:scaffold840_cov350-Prasinococcus_capsulatus_cf.AAC.3